MNAEENEPDLTRDECVSCDENVKPCDPCSGCDLDPSNGPQDPSTRPHDPSTRPQDPATRPHDPSTRPQDPSTRPHDPSTRPQDPSNGPQDPSNGPHDPATRSHDPSNRLQDPSTRPHDPLVYNQSAPLVRSHDPPVKSCDAPSSPCDTSCDPGYESPGPDDVFQRIPTFRRRRTIRGRRSSTRVKSDSDLMKRPIRRQAEYRKAKSEGIAMLEVKSQTDEDISQADSQIKVRGQADCQIKVRGQADSQIKVKGQTDGQNGVIGHIHIDPIVEDSQNSNGLCHEIDTVLSRSGVKGLDDDPVTWDEVDQALVNQFNGKKLAVDCRRVIMKLIVLHAISHSITGVVTIYMGGGGDIVSFMQGGLVYPLSCYVVGIYIYILGHTYVIMDLIMLHGIPCVLLYIQVGGGGLECDQISDPLKKSNIRYQTP